MIGFKFIIKGKCCSFYNNNVYYGLDTYTNSLYMPTLNAQIQYK